MAIFALPMSTQSLKPPSFLAVHTVGDIQSVGSFSTLSIMSWSTRVFSSLEPLCEGDMVIFVGIG